MPKIAGWKKKVDTRLRKIWTFELPSGERIAKLVWSKKTSGRYSPIDIVLEVGNDVRKWTAETIQQSFYIIKKIKEEISEEIYG